MRMKRIVLILLPLILVMAFIVPGIAEAATQTARSQSGTFDGTNSPTINVGGNCPPVNVRMDVTGKCEGTGTKGEGCGTPVMITGNYGLFIRRDASASVGGMCFVGSCSVSIANCCSDSKSTSGYSGLYPSCGCSQFNEALGMGGSYSSSCAAYGCGGYSCGITTYYTPCTKEPQAIVNLTTWKYNGLVMNTTTISIPIGTGSNPSSSPSGYVGAKVPIGNIVLGNNLISMSALELNKFDYTLYWTQETASGGGDADGDGYYSSASGKCTLGNDCNDNDSNVNPGRLEVAGNGKDDNCDGAIDTLYINSMADITAYCPYNPVTYTYSCTGGWSNIYANADISLPSDCPYGCSSCGDWEPNEICGTCSPRNILFEANNEVSLRNFYTSTPGGPGGGMTIEAKKITATSLNADGSLCSVDKCGCTLPECGSNYGGPIVLKADTVNVGTISANDGQGIRNSGGTITVVANTSATINSISATGAAYSCSYDYGYDNGAGSGGSVSIKSKTATLGTINLNGGASNYATNGGSGGTARLEVDNLTLNSISAQGASRYGSGGTVTILSSVSSITGGVYATGNTASGAPGADGSIRLSADSIRSLGSIATRGSDSGGSVKLYLDAYNLTSVSSNYVSLSTDNTPLANQTFISATSMKIYGRAKKTLFGFNTSIPDLSAKSFQVMLKEMNGTYHMSYGYVWSEKGTITQPGKVHKDIGRDTPITGFKGGKKYYLELTTSSDTVFDAPRCGSGAATCTSYDIGFVEW